MITQFIIDNPWIFVITPIAFPFLVAQICLLIKPFDKQESQGFEDNGTYNAFYKSIEDQGPWDPKEGHDHE